MVGSPPLVHVRAPCLEGSQAPSSVPTGPGGPRGPHGELLPCFSDEQVTVYQAGGRAMPCSPDALARARLIPRAPWGLRTPGFAGATAACGLGELKALARC